jgi:hypothetical protein
MPCPAVRFWAELNWRESTVWNMFGFSRRRVKLGRWILRPVLWFHRAIFLFFPHLHETWFLCVLEYQYIILVFAVKLEPSNESNHHLALHDYQYIMWAFCSFGRLITDLVSLTTKLLCSVRIVLLIKIDGIHSKFVKSCSFMKRVSM